MIYCPFLDNEIWFVHENRLLKLLSRLLHSGYYCCYFVVFCLNTLDLRNYFNKKQAKYIYKDQLISMSLEDSIKSKLFKEQDLKKHYFFDNSHLTNLGNSELAKVILKEYLKTPNQKACLLNKISLD